MIGACAAGIINTIPDVPINTNSAIVQVESNVSAANEESYISIASDSYESKIDYSEETESQKDDVIIVSVNYEDRSSTVKAQQTQSYYSGMLTKYATMYGVDPTLAVAIATQERGIHSTVMDRGGATGLMQIQNSVWLGQRVTAYNFETKTNESFTVTLDKIQNLEYNIKIGCMILQNSLQYMKYNTLAAIQCYNMGCGSMQEILGSYAKNTNKTIDQVLDDVTDTGWLDYRKMLDLGDPNYIENVLSWIGDDVEIKNIKRDGTLVDININNNLETKKVY